MLILSRQSGEAIRIGPDIRIVVTHVGGGKVRLGIEGPKDMRILREELYLRFGCKALRRRHDLCASTFLRSSVTTYSTRFGLYDITPEQCWICTEPMPGFEELREFALLQQPGQVPFIWLQSLQVANLAFLIADAASFGLRFQAQDHADLADFDARPGVLVILPQKLGDALRVHRLAPLLFDVARARFAQHVFEPEQVFGLGEWAGPSSAWLDAAWLARIVQLHSFQTAAAAGSGSVLSIP
jgi:carbon storage regulator CsrA